MDFDIAIVGSGFGGAMLAMVARRLGLSVVLLERGTHPRFAIGESTSPLMNLLIEQLAVRYNLPRLLPLTTYGAWQRAYPELVCGLKRGFTYYHHEAGQPYTTAPDRSNQLMVAASPRDEIADTHWLRESVDHFLVNEAVAQGAEYLDRTALHSAVFGLGGAILEGARQGKPLKIRARFVVDAGGPGGFLSRALDLPAGSFENYPPTQTLYSHFTDVRRCDEMAAFAPQATPPYAPDDAALHHVFDGGWMWVLRFNNGVASAGVAVEKWLAQELNLPDGKAAWTRLMRRFPSIGEQFQEAQPIREFTFAPRMSHRVGRAAGNGWALLPSSAGFVDPLFSTGMPLTLLGIERLGRILETSWGTPSFSTELQRYGDITLTEAEWTAQFISACYAGMNTFPLFSAFSMFYFAAASYSEMARRLEQPGLVSRFLAGDRAAFACGLEQCASRLRFLAAQDTKRPDRDQEMACFASQVAASIESTNVAGLCQPRKQNWYGVELEDVIQGSEKMGMHQQQMREIIAATSWT